MTRLAFIFVLGLTFGAVVVAAFRPAAPNSSDPLVANSDLSADRAAAGGNAAVDATSRRAVVALGTIEPRDGVVQVGSALAGYQIRRVLVTEGQFVKPGDTLIELDSRAATAEHSLAASQLAEAREQQRAQIDLATERVSSAQLAVVQAQAGRPLELEAQQSRLAVATAKHKQAQADVEYFEKLRKLAEPLATQQQVEHQRLLLEGAAAELEATQVAGKRLEQTLKFQQQAAEAELRAAQQSLAIAERGRSVESLERRVELSELRLEQTRITAPQAGVILSITAHPGEVVAQQPLLQLADLDHLVCSAEVEAGDVPYLKTAGRAMVRCRAFQNSVLTGTIDRVGNQVGQASLRPLDPRKPVDRDVTKVVVTIDAQKVAQLINTSDNDRRAALVGLQVEVAFPLGAGTDPAAF